MQQTDIVTTPCSNDVLCGRGKSVNNHPGNVQFQSLVKSVKLQYVHSQKSEKPKYANYIVHNIRNMDPPGRFLKLDKSTGLWYDIGNKKAVTKTRQALREGAPDLERHLSKEIEGKYRSPRANDVLCGRGKKVNDYPGNLYFQSLVKSVKTRYVHSEKADKPKYANYIVNDIKNLDPPGSFLQLDKASGLWYDIGEKEALAKTRQALREGAAKIEEQLQAKESREPPVIEAGMWEVMDALLLLKASGARGYCEQDSRLQRTIERI